MARFQDAEITSVPGGIYANDGPPVTIVSSFFIALCTILVALRFAVAHIYSRPKGLEDWLSIPALLTTVAVCTTSICSVIYAGGGRHRVYLKEYKPEILEQWPKWLMATQVMYILSVMMAKLTILAFYLRIFNIQTWVRWTTLCLIAIIIMWGIAGTLVSIFQCNPVAFMWSAALKGTCIDQRGFYKWICVPTFIHDLGMLLLPLPSTFKLQISFRRKIALAFVFLIGSFGCVASFLRMYYFFTWPRTYDPTWDGAHLLPWTVAEPAVILVCACLPSLWPLIQRMPCLGSLAGETAQNTSGGSKGFTNQQQSHPGWSTHSRSHIRTQDDDFIPLYDIEDRPVGAISGGSSYCCKQASRQPSDQEFERTDVINVKREFSVE